MTVTKVLSYASLLSKGFMAILLLLSSLLFQRYFIHNLWLQQLAYHASGG